jgi:hypothetical protein
MYGSLENGEFSVGSYENPAFKKAKKMLWEKYKDACVGFAMDKEVLIYSYSKMIAIENAIVNDDNLANANVYDFIKNFADKSRLVYLDEAGISEYPFDNKVDFIVSEWQQNGYLEFEEEINLESNLCKIRVTEIPNFFRQQENLDIFLKHIENSAKYMKINKIQLYFEDDANTKWINLFGEDVETTAVSMFTKHQWIRTEDWELTFIKTYGNN